MSDDNYRPVVPGEHTLEVYPIGVRAGMAIRLKRDLSVDLHFNTLGLDGVFSEAQPGHLTSFTPRRPRATRTG